MKKPSDFISPGMAAVVALLAAVNIAQAQSNAPQDVVQFARPVFVAHEQDSNATVVIERRNPSATAITVNFATSDGTANSVADYLAQAVSVLFSNGQSRAVVTVPIVDDSIIEPSETVNLTLSGVSAGATLGTRTTARLVIMDNDRAGHVKFARPFFRVSETGGVAIVTVVRSGGKASGVMVGYSTSDGTAISGKDYVSTSGTLTFGAGETSKTFGVPILPDALTERVESVNLKLVPLSGSRLVGKENARLLIYEGAVPGDKLADDADDEGDDNGQGNGKGKGKGKGKGPKGGDDDDEDDDDGAEADDDGK